MTRLAFTAFAVVLTLAIGFGLMAGGGFGKAAETRANTEATLVGAQVRVQDQRTVDQAALDELTLQTRAEAVATRDFGLALVTVGFTTLAAGAVGVYLVIWGYHRSRGPQVRRSGHIVVVFIPQTGDVLAYDERVPALPAVAGNGPVQVPALPPAAILAAIDGRTMEAVAKSLERAATARERAEVLRLLGDFVEALGRPRKEVEAAAERSVVLYQ